VLKAAWTLAGKDLRLSLGRGGGLVQALLLGLLLIFVFSLSLLPGQRMSPQGAASIFWMATAFCQVLIFSTLYAAEEINGQRQGLVMLPAPTQCVWLGKALAGFCLMLLAQLLFLPAIVIFLGQDVSGHWPLGLAMAALADVGIVAVGSLLGALSQGQSARESLLSIVVFPLLVPLFLCGIRIGSAVFSSSLDAAWHNWFGVALAFDAIFVAASLLLFPAIYNAEE
jgi:heme exporter protein B